MNKPTEDEDLWYWYEKILKAKTFDGNDAEFCKQEGIKYTKFTGIKYRIIFKFKTNPNYYKKLLKLTLDYKNQTDSKSIFAYKHEVKENDISDMQRHLNHLLRIKELHKKKKIPYRFNGVVPLYPSDNEDVSEPESPEKMNFIAINQDKAAEKAHERHQSLVEVQEELFSEVIPVANDIELKISTGVRVLLSPDVDATKIIKIINLLKEL